tara:strand:- start:290 stop:424 length:135 start_codon:yes stop_codon:yes gene_type:complete
MILLLLKLIKLEANVTLVGTTAFKADVPLKNGRWVRFPHVSAKF